MKQNFFVVASMGLALFIASCSGSSDKSNDSSKTPETPTSSSSANSSTGSESATSDTKTTESSSSTNSDCDQFLGEYERYVMDYLDFMKKMKDNPTDASLMTELTSYSSKATQWASRWQKISKDCAGDPSYQQKYLDILNRYTEALQGM
jgi:cytoskeletal protein RodZ